MGHARGLGPHPVTDEKQVRWWIIANVPAVEVAAFVEGGAPSPVMALACDVFWISASKLRHDLKKSLKEVTR